MSDPLEIRLLGPFEVLAGGRPTNVSGSKRHALLALLALRRGHVVGVDTLIDALWEEDLPASPRNAVQHHVARLRAALGHEAIAASPEGYGLNDAAVDALEFETLLAEARVALREGDARRAVDAVDRALGLWRGAALQGLTETAWFAAEARRLEALRVDALEERFDAELARGEHRELVPELRATLAENPFRERLWAQLMLALYRSGRQADALEAFQEARRVLSEELALEPGPELRRLQEAILAQDPAIAPVPVQSRPRGNLPAPSTSFVGRESDLAEVVELVGAHRLVTLTGPPGVGKSRLGLEAARSVEGTLAGGAWFVDLARAGDYEDVIPLVAHALDARGSDPLARVVARLRDADALLLFDACEHVLDEAARVISILLADCGGVRVLATSREVLRVAGEARVSVGPLPLADGPDGESPAVELFVERARAARPGFDLSPEARTLVAEISRRVDGLPLAIELTAARVNALGLGELLAIVDDRLALLRDRPETDEGRAGLAALVEWSYDVLHSDERTLLHQLAVHRGGASLASLTAVAAEHGLEEATVTYLLGGLVDKSIVLVSFPGGAARYDLLDTVRDYAVERLAAAGALDAARRAHAAYFATLADTARPSLRAPDWNDWVGRLEVENDNLWAALDYALAASDGSAAVRLGSGAAWYFALADRVSEGRRFTELALAAAPADAPVELRLELAAFFCYLATEELDLDAAIEAAGRALTDPAAETVPGAVGLVQASLALALAEADQDARAAALATEACENLERAGEDWPKAAGALLRAFVAAHAGDSSTVATMIAAASRHAAAAGFDMYELPVALLEAWVHDQTSEPEAAIAAYRRALEHAGRLGLGDHAAFALAGLGAHALARGDLSEAEELMRSSLAAAEAAQAPWAGAFARLGLARVLSAAGEPEASERLLRAIVKWSEAPHPHGTRESLFIVLSGDPAAAAQAELAALAGTAPVAPA